MASVRLIGIAKRYDDTVAVQPLDLQVADGEFVTLLGPSGSGKTTVLRMIAGFERPTAGTVSLRGHDVTAAPPFDRDVHTVGDLDEVAPEFLAVLGQRRARCDRRLHRR